MISGCGWMQTSLLQCKILPNYIPHAEFQNALPEWRNAIMLSALGLARIRWVSATQK